MTNSEGDMVVKPCTPDEIAFYDSVAAHPDLRPYIPAYFGALSLRNDTSTAAAPLLLPPETKTKEIKHAKTASVPVVNHAWKPSGGGKIETEQALVLENVASGFTKPNILDVKLGARLWADDAPLEKRAKLDKVASETTSQPLGFRIAGMKVYHGSGLPNGDRLDTGGYKIFDKNYGRALSVDRVEDGFKEFFRLQSSSPASSQIRKVIKRFISDLEGLVSVLAAEESRMYSASLLFVYEGDSTALQGSLAREAEMVEAHQGQKGRVDGEAEPEELKQGSDNAQDRQAEGKGTASEDSSSDDGGRPNFPAIQNVRLIDFAHAQWTAGQGPDENLLHGVKSVVSVLQALL